MRRKVQVTLFENFSLFRLPPLPVRDVWLGLPGMAGKIARTLNGGKAICESREDKLIINLDVLNEYEALIIE